MRIFPQGDGEMAHRFEFPASVEVIEALEGVFLGFFVGRADCGHEPLLKGEKGRRAEFRNRFRYAGLDARRLRGDLFPRLFRLPMSEAESGEEQENQKLFRHSR